MSNIACPRVARTLSGDKAVLAALPLSIFFVTLLSLSNKAHANIPQRASLDGGTLLLDAGTAVACSWDIARVRGSVISFDGKVLPAGAFVTLSSSDRANQMLASIDDKGRYTFCSAPDGNYSLEADADGLRSAVKSGIRLKNGDKLFRDLVLELDYGPKASITSALAEGAGGVIAVVVFLIGMLVTRWFKVVKPNHNSILQYIDNLKQQVISFGSHSNPPSPPAAPTPTLKELEDKLAKHHALYAGSTTRKALPSRLFRLLFWSQGTENATWRALHLIESDLALFLSDDTVTADLVVAERKLQQLGTDAEKFLADRIHDEQSKASPNVSLKHQLLSKATTMLFEARDDTFVALSEWQNKATWLALLGLLLMVVLGATLGNIMLFIVGAAGGLLSRMIRAIRQPTFSNDYGASWSTLFLSPLFGALSAWFGIGLIVLLAHPKVAALGTSFRLVRWEDTLSLATLSTAFLLGFSERFFDSITDAAHATDGKTDSAGATK